jgi:hypothetical protein
MTSLRAKFGCGWLSFGRGFSPFNVLPVHVNGHCSSSSSVGVDKITFPRGEGSDRAGGVGCSINRQAVIMTILIKEGG